MTKEEKKEQRNLREEVLLDTLNYYTEDTSRRCVGNDGVCYYHPSAIGKTKEQTEGCAVGRLLSDYHAKKLLEKNPCAEDLGRYINLPKKFEVLELGFLSNLQNLHDSSRFWKIGKGLTGEGEVRLSNIIKRFKLRKTPFKKYL